MHMLLRTRVCPFIFKINTPALLPTKAAVRRGRTPRHSQNLTLTSSRCGRCGTPPPSAAPCSCGRPWQSAQDCNGRLQDLEEYVEQMSDDAPHPRRARGARDKVLRVSIGKEQGFLEGDRRSQRGVKERLLSEAAGRIMLHTIAMRLASGCEPLLNKQVTRQASARGGNGDRERTRTVDNSGKVTGEKADGKREERKK
mmetsp:Transcript_36037/g.56049  ORF Transcript_36037/g.56049 Transcript_36037/m.56049 type:complete len:198 (-) Transcript_36037:159-752(-)